MTTQQAIEMTPSCAQRQSTASWYDSAMLCSLEAVQGLLWVVQVPMTSEPQHCCGHETDQVMRVK